MLPPSPLKSSLYYKQFPPTSLDRFILFLCISLIIMILVLCFSHSQNTNIVFKVYCSKLTFSTMVNVFKIKVRTFIKVFVTLSCLYILLLRKMSRKAEFNLHIANAKPEDVWNVMADFRYTKRYF